MSLRTVLSPRRLGRALLVLPLVCLPAACRLFEAPPPEEFDLWADSAAGVTHPSLARLASRYWESYLAAHPIEATYVGDPRYHGALPLGTIRWKEARDLELEGMRRRVRVLLAADLTEADRITAEMLGQAIDKERAHLALDLETWSVDPLEGPHLKLLNLASVQPHGTPREREQLVQRWQRMDAYIDQARRNLERGKRNGLLASRTAVAKTIQQLDEILATDVFDSPLVRIVDGGGRWVVRHEDQPLAAIAFNELGDARRVEELVKLNHHAADSPTPATSTKILIAAEDDPLSVEERGDLLASVLQAVRDLYVSLGAYRDYLQQEILPAARSDERPGLSFLEGGEEIYATLIREHLTLPAEECDPKAIHEFGKQEVARIRAEIADLGERVFGTRDMAILQERLRHDADMHFTTRDEVEAKARESLARARSRVPEFFGRLPETPCEVVRIPAFEERDTTIAYYRGPSLDGSRPGRYYINTYQPDTRPRYEAEVLAFHEAIPGHHLQIALANELEDIPLFRRHGGSTAFVEGWALYTERLCQEIGLYSGDLDLLGVLSFDAWRACRLVVDTGIHHFGWSRERAIEYLYENTLLARNNVENEVDRYIAWPGQALAYKIGQREILELRDRAREVLGNRFRYPTFHDHVLENGAVSLTTLRGVVERWLERETAEG